MAIDAYLGLTTPLPGQQTLRQRQTETPEEALSQTGTQTPPSAQSCQLELTEGSAHLAEIEARLAAAPDIDEARVAQIRNELARGALDIDPMVIANNLLETDKDLF